MMIVIFSTLMCFCCWDVSTQRMTWCSGLLVLLLSDPAHTLGGQSQWTDTWQRVLMSPTMTPTYKGLSLWGHHIHPSVLSSLEYDLAVSWCGQLSTGLSQGSVVGPITCSHAFPYYCSCVNWFKWFSKPTNPFITTLIKTVQTSWLIVNRLFLIMRPQSPSCAPWPSSTSEASCLSKPVMPWESRLFSHLAPQWWNNLPALSDHVSPPSPQLCTVSCQLHMC